METTHTDQIAGIVGRIDNEAADQHVLAGNAGDSQAVAQLFARRILEESGAQAPDQTALSFSSPAAVEPRGDSQALERISEIFQSLEKSERPVDGIPLTTAGDLPLDQLNRSSLSRSADSLVAQQTYNGNQDNYGNLKAFVSRIQSCGHRLTGGISGGTSFADPFAELLKISLPETNKLTASRAFDVEAIRRDFPVLNQKVHGKQLVWFDNAATTQKPQSVIDAINRFYTYDNSNIHRGAHTLAARATDAFEGAREKIRKYINAGSASEIIYVRGTTEGINLVAQSFGRKFIRQGDEILVSTLEHHANIVPWQMVAKENGAVLRAIPINDRGDILLDEYERLLGPRTRLVALAHANNSLGTVLPVEEMTRLAKRHGAVVLIDGAQSVAHLPVDVQQFGCDYFVFSGHKIFGPTGIGAVYGRKELLEIMPPWQGGGNMIKSVTFEETTYSDIPAKFEAGTPNVADAHGLGVALEYVKRIGRENIARHEHQLLEYATEQLGQLSFLRLIGSPQEKVAVLSFVHRDRPVEEVGKFLNQHGIAVRSGHHCAQPSLRRFALEATVRPSFSFYNTFEEIDRMVAALKQLR
jgi:cysteine desulfurase / selenocysteine lyase